MLEQLKVKEVGRRRSSLVVPVVPNMIVLVYLL
jgi:hypothetical protein